MWGLAILPVAIIVLMVWALWRVNHSGDDNYSKGQFIFVLILWLILLVFTIVLLAMGVKPQDLIGAFLGLASPLIVFLTSLKRGD